MSTSVSFRRSADRRGLISSATAAQPWRFVEITRDMPDEIIGQLVGKDRVHERGASSIEDLCRHRLGGEGFTHRCFAIMVGDKIQSAIYVDVGFAKINNYLDLNGDIGQILTTESEYDPQKPKSFVCYSISAIGSLKNAGQTLINELHAHLTSRHPDAHLTTLSPARPFDAWFEKNWRDYHSIEEAGAHFLLNGHNIFEREGSMRPGVHGFHAGNGAYLGAVRIDSGDISNEEGKGITEHRLMVHHIYHSDPKVLLGNIEQTKKVQKIILASSLQEPETAKEVCGILSSICANDILMQAGIVAPPMPALGLHA